MGLLLAGCVPDTYRVPEVRTTQQLSADQYKCAQESRDSQNVLESRRLERLCMQGLGYELNK